ncbi:M23/M56 family metallopeptidase [Aliikangiella sp. G2MR2-5]|uniref:M23/M56 family metallopeptidase n=1 Tax=Aliikangiella sp. G2MR2-5 TaxID=2788943 RepID=UPI0018AA21B4|nr:M23/M56 family metallopeptidase [Aliikangiella sp. G2MR2-5]
MTDQVSMLSEQLVVAAFYSIIVATLAFVTGKILLKIKPQLASWKALWLALTGFAHLPFIISFFPRPASYWPVFDLSSLQSMEQTASVNLIEVTELIASVSSPIQTRNLIIGLFAIYCLGLIYHLVQFVGRCYRMNQLLRQSESLQQGADRLSKRNYDFLSKLQRQCKLEVRLNNQVTTPFISQTYRTTLVIPYSTLNELNNLQLRLVVRHEWHHKKSNDGRLQWLFQILLCFNWFNPFCRSLVRLSNWAIEASCDEKVLNNKTNLRRTYALAMLKILRRSATDLSHQPVAAFSSQSNRSITMRINHIMDPSAKGFKSFLSRLTLFSASAAFSLATIAAQPTTEVTGEQILINPLPEAKLTSPYGERNKFHKFHNGMDLAAETGTPILAAASGKVIISTEKLKGKTNYGTIIILDHGNGLQTIYSHLSKLNVREGETVKQGEVIGRVGATGKATGPHLHLEVHQNSKAVNPANFIRF